jgi:multicopper oxidase
LYNGQFPGPEIRVTEGERLRVTVENGLPEPTTIHWHGIPVPNAMDGVPGVTQDPIQPGETFVYDFVTDIPGSYGCRAVPVPHRAGLAHASDRSPFGTRWVR